MVEQTLKPTTRQILYKGNRLSVRLSGITAQRWDALVQASGKGMSDAAVEAVCAFSVASGGPASFDGALDAASTDWKMNRTTLVEVAINWRFLSLVRHDR